MILIENTIVIYHDSKAWVELTLEFMFLMRAQDHHPERADQIIGLGLSEPLAWFQNLEPYNVSIKIWNVNNLSRAFISDHMNQRFGHKMWASKYFEEKLEEYKSGPNNTDINLMDDRFKS